MHYVCKKCGKTYDEGFSGWRCACKSSLWLENNIHFTRRDIRQDIHSLWRYAKAFPIDNDAVSVTLGEGMTPLAPAEFYGRRVLVKNDSLMPTGSFKDRGVAMVVNGLRRRGIARITEDSSGNAGASFAAYCACAGIECDLYIPAGTSSGKVTQARSFGAHVHEVEGTRDAVALAAQAELAGSAYGGHNWHPLFVEGVKSVAYEIWEQNGFAAPDNIVCPVGNGSLVAGAYLGFKELLRSGEIGVLPKILGVQAENCNTTYRAFKGLPLDYDVKKTIAEGISLYRPSKVDEEVAMLRECGGDMFAVSEREIVDALRQAVGKGFFIEPTSATAFAGLKRMIEGGTIKEGETTVVIVSGSGLKVLDAFPKLLG